MEIIDQTAKVVMLKGEGGDTIKSIDKTTTQGLVDIYTITLESGNKKTFNVNNGNGIKTIEKTSTSGLIDTYTITFDNGETTTFTVTNGEKGEKGDKGDTGPQGPQGPKGEKGDPGDGGGIANVDTELSVTSTNPVQNKAIAEGINSIQNQSVPTASIEIGETASKAYNVGDFLVKNGVLYKVAKAIAKDDELTVGTNIAMTTVGGELSEIKSNSSNKSFEVIATATANGNVTTTKPLSKFSGFMLSIHAGPLNRVTPSAFAVRELFEIEGVQLFSVDDNANAGGKVKRVDDNTVNFLNFKNVKKAYLIGFY